MRSIVWLGKLIEIMGLPFPLSLLPERFRDARVIEALERVPRAAYLPEPIRHEADRDVALPIGHGQTISQPFIVAYMTAALGIEEGSRVLEVGTGSGYQAAVLATMGAEVFTIETIAELSHQARETIETQKLGHRVRFRVGDGRHGWPTEAPFDAIICTAAPLSVPPAYVEQVRIGGRIVLPLGPPDDQHLRVLERQANGLKEISRINVRFVPLIRPPAEG